MLTTAGALPTTPAAFNDSGVTVIVSSIKDVWGFPAVVIFAIIMVILIIVGTVGNLMVMISILLFKEFRGRSMYFIFNLALTDLLTSVISMPLALATLLAGGWKFSDAVCQFNGFSTEFCFTASMHTLMYISVYRFISINDPLNKGRLKKWVMAVMLLAPWAWAAIICSATYKVLGSYDYLPYSTQCDPEFPKTIAGWSDLWLTTATCFLIPMIVMIVMYALIMLKAHKHLKRLKLHSNIEDKAFQQQQRLSVTFFIIMVAFAVCWCPLMIYNLHSAYVEDVSTLPRLANPAVYWLSYMNSAVNPVLYSLRTPVVVALLRRLRGLKPFSETFGGSDAGNVPHSVSSHHVISTVEVETPFL